MWGAHLALGLALFLPARPEEGALSLPPAPWPVLALVGGTPHFCRRGCRGEGRGWPRVPLRYRPSGRCSGRRCEDEPGSRKPQPSPSSPRSLWASPPARADPGEGRGPVRSSQAQARGVGLKKPQEEGQRPRAPVGR